MSIFNQTYNNTFNNTYNHTQSDDDNEINYSVISWIMLIIISVALAVILFILIRWIIIPEIYYYFEDRRKEKEHQNQNDDLNQISIFNNLEEIVISDRTNYNDMVCSICFENLTDKHIIKLECNHLFHKECLESWYNSNSIDATKSCPLCRDKIVISNLMV